MYKKLLLSMVLAGCSYAYGQSRMISLIPYPQHITTQEGRWKLNQRQLNFYIENTRGFDKALSFAHQTVFKNVSLKKTQEKNAQLKIVLNPSLGKEAYHLQINQNGIRIAVSAEAGLFYAFGTIQQLLLLNGSDDINSLPFTTIQDSPAFAWRGAHLDVSRHFFPKTYIKKFIDLLALYKLNKFHFHLTDDQGWRMEIKKYPKLTDEGAWREFNNQDSACLKKAADNPDFNLPAEHLKIVNGKTLYGGFYTQDDLKEIVAYAASRNIEIIPEIDMPGHMLAATKSYPELLLDGKEAGWGKDFSVPVNPAKESTYTFVQNVLDEVMAVFPSSYIHIGADEVEKTSWQHSALCQELMQKKGMSKLEELQSYFVSRVHQYLKQKGKKVIGWDEILEGPSDPDMLVMYWRGWEKDAPKKAIDRGHQLIMTPTNPMYFDYLPNASTLRAVYDFKVVPDQFIPAERAKVLGGQANIWTEMIPSRERLEFMILPRLTALADRVWTNQHDFSSYESRVVQHFPVLDNLGYKYRLPDLQGFADHQVIVDGKSVLKVVNTLTNGAIHYTTDGSLPAVHSPELKDSIVITQPQVVKFATFSTGGAKSEIYQVSFKNDTWKAAHRISPEKVSPGLKTSFYAGTFINTKAISGQQVKEMVVQNVDLDGKTDLPSFGAYLKGFIQIPEDGKYNFYLTCDDGGVLRIGDELVVDNDGQHSAVVKSGQIALKKGFHPFAVDFIEAGGGFTLKLEYNKEGENIKPVPNEWFFHLK